MNFKVNGYGDLVWHPVHEQNELTFSVTGIAIIPIVTGDTVRLVTTEVTDDGPS